MHVVPVVRLVVVRLHRYPPGAEPVVLGDQLLGGDRILHPLADLVGDELAELARWPPRPSARRGSCPARCGSRTRRTAPRRRRSAPPRGPRTGGAASGLWMKPPGRLPAQLEDLVVATADVGHLRLVDGRVVQRAHQLGWRWKTYSSAADCATTGMSCTAVAPVPMTATRLPVRSSGSLRPVVGVEPRAPEVARCRRPGA